MDTTGSPLVSGEGVALDLPVAGVASRLLAAAIDVVIEAVALLVLLTATTPAVGGSDDDAVDAVALLLVVLVAVGYPVGCEWLARGRTPGKLALGLRVVRDDGGPVAFRQALVRGLAGFVLEKPGVAVPISTFVGVATVVASERDKRIGDLLAGTVVINERAAPQPTASPLTWVPPYLVPWVNSLDLSRLDHRLAHAVRTFVSRAYAMSEAGRAALGEQLRWRVLAVVSPSPPPGVPTPALLQSVLAERRRRAEPSADRPPEPWPSPISPRPRPAPPPVGSAPPPASGSGGFVPPS